MNVPDGKESQPDKAASNTAIYASVVVPAYNGADTLPACLNALVSQDFPADRYEVIVVDDGSTDTTPEVVRQYAARSGSPIIRYFRQTNQGPASARNHGAREAEGQILVFTDADCEPATNWLQEMCRPFSDTSTEITGVKGVYRTRQESVVARFAQMEFEGRYRKMRKLKYVDFIDTYSAAFKKTVFASLGGFDTSFPEANNEDVDFSYRLASKGYKLVFNPAAAVYHRHPATIFKYLKQKFGRAFWRMAVYRTYPEKIKSDSYTPQTLKLQILLSFMILAALAVWLYFGKYQIFLYICLALFILSAIPLFMALTRQPPMKGLFLLLVSPFMLFARGLAMGLGILWSLLPRWMRQGRFSQVFLILLGDVLAICCALIAAHATWGYILDRVFHAPDFPIDMYLQFVPIAFVLILAVFFVSGLYKPARTFSEVTEFVVLTKAVTYIGIMFMAVLYLTKSPHSRLILVLLCFYLWVFTAILRSCARKLYAHYVRVTGGEPTPRVMIAGTGELAMLIARKLENTSALASDIVGFVSQAPDEVGRKIDGHEIVGSLADLGKLIEQFKVTDVFVSLPFLPQDELIDILDRHGGRRGVHFHIVSSIFDMIAGEVDMFEENSLPITYLKNEPAELLSMAVKRLLDITASAFILVVTLPIWIVITIAIRLESHGSAVFRQERVGKNGRIFRIFKFRTMHSNVPQFDYSPSAPGDPRITKVGKFLRKTSLDEFPQLINVLKGEMSLVGPRPEMPFIVEKYKSWERQRLKVKPGLTGLWQIMGRKDLPLHESLEYDFYYIKNQSLLLDLTILLKTIPIVLRGKGAY
ncbi:MAG: exopolysaccharide biosynthesis polyprenyl glycosylphosphotransferase [Kiritimatiellae bacterium]|nr:exopolysaccharide biosynthesis polyprenyl glycosylphosphotransferase [Kiritimatiellia bacterium]